MALGGIFGSLSGGYALTNLKTETIFLLFSILPSIQLFSCSLVEDNSTGSEALPEFSDSENFHGVNGMNNIIDRKNSLEKKSNVSTSRRKRQKDKKEAAIPDKLQRTKKVDSLASQWYRSLKAAIYSLFLAFKQPIIFR